MTRTRNQLHSQMDVHTTHIYLQVLEIAATKPLPTVALVTASAVYAQNPHLSSARQLQLAFSVLRSTGFVDQRLRARFPANIADAAASAAIKILVARALIVVDCATVKQSQSEVADAVFHDLPMFLLHLLLGDELIGNVCLETVHRLTEGLHVDKYCGIVGNFRAFRRLTEFTATEEEDLTRVVMRCLSSPGSPPGSADDLAVSSDDETCSTTAHCIVIDDSTPIFGHMDDDDTALYAMNVCFNA